MKEEFDQVDSLTFIANMDEHSYNYIICEDEIISYAKNCVPENEEIEKVEFSAKQKSQPSAKIRKIN